MKLLHRTKLLIIKVLDYFRYHKSYSQDGEDIVLYSFFEGKKKYKGIYVDIGAHHPVRFSNTYFFYKRGWRGINIDPTPNSMTPFNFLRRRDINLEIGIGKESGSLTFFCFNEPALNTFDEQIAKQRNQIDSYRITKTIAINIEPLKNILQRHIPIGSNIDFFSIDVEGLDLEVLASNDWDNYKPNYILVEDVDFHCSDANKSSIFNFLHKKGYTVIAALKRTIIYKAV